MLVCEEFHPSLSFCDKYLMLLKWKFDELEFN